MAGVNITFEPSAGLTQAFKNLGTLDTQALLYGIGQALDLDTAERFEEERAPDGTRWQASQRAIEDGGKTMTDTAILLSSFHEDVTADQLKYGSNEVYAAIHQFGGKTGRRHSVTMPKRELIGITAQQLTLVDDEVDTFMQAMLP